MSRRPLRLRSFARAWIAVAVLPTAVAAISFASPDRVLEQAYTAPMSRAETQWNSQAPVLEISPASLVPAAGRKPFTVGDRLTIDARGGAAEVIEITAVEQVEGATLGLDGVAFQMVTARSDRDPDGPTLRFLFAVDAPDKPRAL